jgi:hypothetical protein
VVKVASEQIPTKIRVGGARADHRGTAKDTAIVSLAVAAFGGSMSGSKLTRKRFYLYPSETSLGWRMIRMVSAVEGDSKVNAGEWRRVLDPISHLHIGYQLCAPEMSRGDYEMPSMFSPAAISAAEMQVNAGLHGGSRTAHLSEDRRLERRVVEDRVERTRAKVLVWPRVGPARGDILRVWPQEA